MTMRSTSARLRWAAFSAAGSVVALGVHLPFVIGPGGSLLGRVTNGQFYEVQARSLLEGRWDVPPNSIGAERFRVGDRFYEYFGPFPALLRLPVVAVTDRLDGRLSRIAMLLAIGVLLAGVSFLVWHVQGRDADTPVTRRDGVAIALFVFLCGCATPALFLSSWTAVYHEAIAWGAAWSVVSYAFMLGHLRRSTTAPLVFAGVTATFAVLSRASVGLGPVVALAVVAAIRVWRWRRGRSRLPLAAIAAGCAALPLVLSAYVSWAKFGSWTPAPPLDKQDLLLDWPPRLPAMQANDGSLFGPGYAPTILLQYLRPDGFSIDRLFPWFGFSRGPTVVGDAVFEALNPSASIPSGSPVFVLLAASAVVAGTRARRTELVPIAVGAVAGCAGMFLLAFIDHRYLGDALPLMVVAGAVGWTALGQSRRARTRRLLGAGVAITAVWSVWANGSLAYQYQHGWSIGATTASRAQMVRTQLAVHERLTSRPPSRVYLSMPPTVSLPHTLAVTGDCAAVHWSDGREWHPVETTALTGHAFVDLARVNAPRSKGVELASATDRAGTSSVALGASGLVEYRWRPSAPTAKTEVHRSTRAVEGERIEVHLDRAGAFASRVRVTDRRGPLIDVEASLADGALLGRDERVAVTSPPTPICDRLVRLRRYDPAPRP